MAYMGVIRHHPVPGGLLVALGSSGQCHVRDARCDTLGGWSRGSSPRASRHVGSGDQARIAPAFAIGFRTSGVVLEGDGINCRGLPN